MHRESHLRRRRSWRTSETSSLRGLVGSLPSAATHTRPDIAARLAEVQGQVASGAVQIILEASRALREA